MRYSSVIGSLFIAGAIGKPVADPALVYDVQIVEVTTTVVVSAGATPEAEPVVVEHEPVAAPVVYLPEPNFDSVPEFQPEPQPEEQFEQDFNPEPQDEPQPVNSPPVSGSPDGDLKSKVLFHHNMHRDNHTASHLVWSDSLASFAAETAQKCIYDHDDVPGGGGYGQNIARSSGDDIGGIITNEFYNNELELFTQEYGKDQPDSSYKAWGHFTQMVWKGTTEVGCAVVYCEGIGYFSVFNYLPPGNFQNEYAKNVAPPVGNAMYVV